MSRGAVQHHHLRGGQCKPQPPPSWSMHFPAEEFDPNDRRALLIREMVNVFASGGGWELLSRSVRQHLDTYVAVLDYQLLCSVARSADLEAAMDMQPAEGLACLSACVYEVLFSGPQGRGRHLFGEEAPPARVAVRLFNHPASTTQIRLLKSSSIAQNDIAAGKLVSVKGTVVRVSGIKPLVTGMDFVCGKCGESQRCSFPDGKFTEPTRCGTNGCRGRSFVPVHTRLTATDWQKVRVQEVASPNGGNDGRVPRTVEVELHGDLVDSCVAGDVVTVLAIVKAMSAQSSAKGGGGGKTQSALFLLYLEAVAIRGERSSARSIQRQGPCQGNLQGLPAEPSSQQPFSLRDLQFVIKFTQEVDGDQFRHLVRALCPMIFGNELVKAGLLLALAGGVRKNEGDQSKVPIRGDIHVLMVGDPGQGKSQLLQAAATAAPRGIYVGANTCTTAGLTVSIVRDAVTGDYAFEAGAMVLGDQGVCCIDEFDKMSGDSKALLEAMEQQEVSVAKAGLVANLPARTSVLAAANPAGGHYNRGKTVQENLKMSTALLSRFDLVFILMDRPDEDLDSRLSEHVMALHSGEAARTRNAQQRLLEYPRSSQAQLMLQAPSSQAEPQRLPLLQRLKACSEEDGPPLPVPLLRKYISYARQFVKPTIGPEAREVLQAFYLELRRRAAPRDGTPITARQLESLVRLAEARARLELRETVTRDDAMDVVEIMKEALHDKYADEFGLLDFRRSGGKSRQAEAKRFLGALQRISERQGDAMFSASELYSLADELELQVPDLSDFIETLNDQGELLKKGGGMYKLACASVGCSQEGFQGMRKRRR